MATTEDLSALWSKWIDKLDEKGATIVCSVGNKGYDQTTGLPTAYMADDLPQSLATDKSPLIAVGGTYFDGSLWEGSTPSGAWPGEPSSDAKVTVYAQAAQVVVCAAGFGEDATWEVEGTSISSAHVVSHPRETCL